MRFKYRVYDKLTDKWFPGEYTAGKIPDLIGVRADYSRYAKGRWLLRDRYLFEVVEEIRNEVYINIHIYPALCAEWDRVRLEILRRYGKNES